MNPGNIGNEKVVRLSSMENSEYKIEQGHASRTGKFVVLMKRCLETRYMPLMAAGMAVLIMLPALSAGLIQDDFLPVKRLYPSLPVHFTR